MFVMKFLAGFILESLGSAVTNLYPFMRLALHPLQVTAPQLHPFLISFVLSQSGIRIMEVGRQSILQHAWTPAHRRLARPRNPPSQ